MATDSGWYLHTINNANTRLVGRSIPDVTISTDTTGAGDTLQAGETFKVGSSTFTYLGAAQVGRVTGFYASAGNGEFFFSKTEANNRLVNFIQGADTPICFCAGTRIRTPEGDKAVEDLAIGDLILTHDGDAAPVRWIGQQTVSTLFADPLRVQPIRIAAGALANNVPARDLLVSPEHAILVDGVLVQAGALVNGTTIRRETDMPPVFLYYHVELADHALLLAEDVPAETFIDNVDRLAFDNWDEHDALYGRAPPLEEMDRPRAKSHRQVPAALRARLAQRALMMTGPAIAAA